MADTAPTTKRNRRRRARARLAAQPGRPATRIAGLNEKAAKLIRRACNAFNPNLAAAPEHLRVRVTAAPHRERGRLLARIEGAVAVVQMGTSGRQRFVLQGPLGDALRAELLRAEHRARLASDRVAARGGR